MNALKRLLLQLNLFNIKVSGDWIRTRILWYGKRPCCQLCHNHWLHFEWLPGGYLLLPGEEGHEHWRPVTTIMVYYGLERFVGRKCFTIAIYNSSRVIIVDRLLDYLLVSL